MVVGFSTGSLAKSDFRVGVTMMSCTPARAIELSALREDELQALVDALDTLELDKYRYVSIHAPSRLERLTEADVVEVLNDLPRRFRQAPIVTHPDVIRDASVWNRLGSRLCIENMDKRKATGRTADELAEIFERSPDAKFCFDAGHARQIDPTMFEAHRMLSRFGDRLRQVHFSFVNTASGHEPLNFESLHSLRKIVDLLPPDVPIILETPVTSESRLRREIDLLKSVLTDRCSES